MSNEMIIIDGIEYEIKVDKVTTYQNPNTHSVTLIRVTDRKCTWFTYPKDESDHRNARFYNIPNSDGGIDHPRNFEDACKSAIVWRLSE